MTPLYRLTADQSPSFGRGTLWALKAESTERLARFEALPDELSPEAQLYQADEALDLEVAVDVSDEARRVADRDWLPAVMLAHVIRRASGAHWALLTDHGVSWHDAILYVGDGFVRARPVPRPTGDH